MLDCLSVHEVKDEPLARNFDLHIGSALCIARAGREQSHRARLRTAPEAASAGHRLHRWRECAYARAQRCARATPEREAVAGKSDRHCGIQFVLPGKVFRCPTVSGGIHDWNEDS